VKKISEQNKPRGLGKNAGTATTIGHRRIQRSSKTLGRKKVGGRRGECNSSKKRNCCRKMVSEKLTTGETNKGLRTGKGKN